MEANVIVESETTTAHEFVVTIDVSKLPARDIRCIERLLTKSRIKVRTPEEVSPVGIPFQIQLIRS